MKSAPLALAGGRGWSLATEPLPVDGDRMTALIHNERQRWKKVNFFAKKPLPRSLLQHVQTCACPVSLTCIHTQHQPLWRRLLAVETLPIDRTTGEDLRARSIAIEVKHETLPANRTRLFAAPIATASRSTYWHAACSRRSNGHCSQDLDGHHLVMTGQMHDDQGPVEKEGRDGGGVGW